ncbi:hypothetical protein HP398_05320 [Brevibacillus sp. HB1.4B]|uniref:DUF6173 family protein n=1 Tax=Brevibacillus sp. HB1.4B TaxID=2738845 RepID=UPI00156B3743|nr:DUF6173 family protein [Brevibacillus sp. HB1.4B]NRS15853.1 hypothetical protein [Brevibacillus sp. HB1.4B]
MDYSRLLDSIEPIRFGNPQLADRQYEILMESIREFESELDEDHEIGVKLASFGQSILMHVTDIGYSNPSLIHFYGQVDGKDAELIQHVNQLNFLLMAVPVEGGRSPRRIGFSVDRDEDED